MIKPSTARILCTIGEGNAQYRLVREHNYMTLEYRETDAMGNARWVTILRCGVMTLSYFDHKTSNQIELLLNLLRMLAPVK